MKPTLLQLENWLLFHGLNASWSSSRASIIAYSARPYTVEKGRSPEDILARVEVIGDDELENLSQACHQLANQLCILSPLAALPLNHIHP